MTFEVKRSDAVNLLEIIGCAKAADWELKKMNGFLNQIEEAMPSDFEFEDDDAEALLVEIMTALKADKKIEVVADDETPEVAEVAVDDSDEEEDAANPADDDLDGDALGKPGCAPEKPAKKKRGRPKGSKGKAKDEAPAAEKGDKGKAKPKASKPKKSRGVVGPDVGTPEGVRSIKNRRFVAGIVIRENGIEAGITEEMVKSVDERLGVPNPKLSKRMLVDGWHIINGYING